MMKSEGLWLILKLHWDAYGKKYHKYSYICNDSGTTGIGMNMTESDDEDQDDCIVILPGDDVSLDDEYEDDNDEQGRERRTRMWGV